jgi:HSP90 family molecular chaperone
VHEKQKELKIYILLDEENNHISITDAGIGMTTSQLISNINRILRS